VNQLVENFLAFDEVGCGVWCVGVSPIRTVAPLRNIAPVRLPLDALASLSVTWSIQYDDSLATSVEEEPSPALAMYDV